LRTLLMPRRGETPALRSSAAARSGRGRTRCLAVAMVICVLACAPMSGLAKQKKKISKTISGVVMDASGNPIAGAAVELTDKLTGKKVAIFAQEGGSFRFADLDPKHDYELQALSKNLSSDVRKVSSLDDRDNIVVNLTIQPPKQ